MIYKIPLKQELRYNMIKKTYKTLEKKTITCSCGFKINTANVEYFCPCCNTTLATPKGGRESVASVVSDFADEVV